MASRRTDRSLPDDPETLRFYLDGVHHFVHWSEREITTLDAGMQGQFGRLFLAFQQILEPYLGVGKEGKGTTIHPAVVYPSASRGKPFVAMPAFLAIQPFLDHKELVALLADCRTAVEEIEPMPSSLSVDRSFGERQPIKIGRIKKRDELNAENVSETWQHASPSQEPAKKEANRKLRVAFAAFEALLAPFRNLTQRIVLKMAHAEQPDAIGQDASGYLPATWLVGIDNRVKTYKKLKSLVDNNTDKIRQRKPLSKEGKTRSQRLEINVADLLRFLHEADSAAFDDADRIFDSDKSKSKTPLKPDMEDRRNEIRMTHGLPDTAYEDDYDD